MRAVDLLPKQAIGGGRGVPPLPVLVGCVGVVVATAVLALMFLSASSNVSQQRRALDEAQAAYSALPPKPTASALDSNLSKQRQTRVTALASALGQRVAWDRLLREVSQVVPNDVWLVSLNGVAPTTAPAAPVTPGVLPTGFTIAGCTYSLDSVARFLARLDVVPDLSAMTLATSGTSGTGASGLALAPGTSSCPVPFTLQGNVRSAGATS
jgi:Tfp pilus assembly protein PilN